MSQTPKRRAVKKALVKPAGRLTKQPRTPNPEDLTVEEMVAPHLEAMRENKAKIAKLSEAVEEDQLAALNIMSEFGAGSVNIVAADGGKIQATIVAGETDTLDENMLKKNLGATLWTKLLTRVLDKRKLDAFIASGEVDAGVVAACTTSKPKKKYIKVTVK